MILSPYNNPPYKPPTRNPKISSTHNQPSTSTSGSSSNPTPTPTAHPKTPPISPKRKHANMAHSSSSPTITHPHLAPGPSSSAGGTGAKGSPGNESPRTKVAEQFQRLDLELGHRASSPGDLEGGSPRKRARRGWVVESGEVGETPLGDRMGGEDGEGEVSKEDELESLLESKTKANDHHQMTTSPTAVPRHGTPPLPTKDTSNSNHDSPDQDRTALTWQDSEITGHDIDAADGDDDGEGINGIGFRPTPAMAWSRKQRRRQQVNEWRVREAREARMRRLERRRGGNGIGIGKGVLEGDDGERRAVRFAEEFHLSGS